MLAATPLFTRSSHGTGSEVDGRSCRDWKPCVLPFGDSVLEVVHLEVSCFVQLLGFSYYSVGASESQKHVLGFHSVISMSLWSLGKCEALGSGYEQPKEKLLRCTRVFLGGS